MPKKKKKNKRGETIIIQPTAMEIVNRMRGDIPENERGNLDEKYEALIHIDHVESMQLRLIRTLLNQLELDTMIQTQRISNEVVE